MTVSLVYDDDRTIEEFGFDGTVSRRYVYEPGADEPLIWYEGSGTGDRRFLHADERGSVVEVTDNSGAVLNIKSYDEYGIPADTNAAYAGRFGYTGQRWIPALGLWDDKARMYSPTLGRFLQTDPIGYGDGLNWYRYAGNDPVNGSDPTGLEEEIVVTGQALSLCEREPFNQFCLGGGIGGGGGGGLGGVGSGSGLGGGGGGGGAGGGGGGGVEAGGPRNGQTGCDGCINPSTATTDQLRASILYYGGYYNGNTWIPVNPLLLTSGASVKDVLLIASLAVGIGEAAIVADVAATGAAALAEEGAVTAEGTADAMSGARLSQQLGAEQAAGAQAPSGISSWSTHALDQIAGRDAGIGVSQSALEDAFANPNAIQYAPSAYGPTFRFLGNNATIVVNPSGNVVTGWATSSAGIVP